MQESYLMAVSSLPLTYHKKPISKVATGDQYHFPVQWPEEFYFSRSSPGLQQMEIGPFLQMGIMMRLSRASKFEVSMRKEKQNRNSAIKLPKKFSPVQQIGKGDMPLPVFQPLIESRHLQGGIHLASVDIELLMLL